MSVRPLIYGHPSREGLLHRDLRLTTHLVSPPLSADVPPTPGNIGPLWWDCTGPPRPPGVPSSYLLNLLCPPWYGFSRPLSFGLHPGFFNYVVHFTCLCCFTPQDQGPKGSHLIISKQELWSGPHRSIYRFVTSCFPIYCSITTTLNKQYLGCYKRN